MDRDFLNREFQIMHATTCVATTELALLQTEKVLLLRACNMENGGHKQIKSDPGDEIEYTRTYQQKCPHDRQAYVGE
jgi:hypothetical protein